MSVSYCHRQLLLRSRATFLILAKHNKGSDNADYDLILAANDEIVNDQTGRVYYAKEVLGKGTFG